MQPEPFAAAKRQFIDFWGEMASSWGISRTMSQVFALLFACPQPMDTDAIMEALGISRGNANINLHKLMNWGLVRKAEVPDSRKDFFVAETDVWRMTLSIIRNRQARELAPVQDSLRAIADSLLVDADGQPRQPTVYEEAFRQNLLNMGQFMVMFTNLTALLLPLLESHNPERLHQLIGLLQSAGGSHPAGNAAPHSEA